MADLGLPSTYHPFLPFSEWADEGVGGAWGEFLAGLEAAREAARPEDLQAAVDYALRTAAVQTGALEGLYPANRGVTRVVAVQGALWESVLDKIGPDVRGHFEAQLAAFDLVLDAATTRQPMSEAWLREVHAEICANQRTYRVLTALGWQDQELKHGEYKGQENNVTLADGSIHWYAPVLDTPGEMHRLMEELRSPLFLAAHPVLQAAFAHHALTAVHPFPEGNGRVARALASVFIYRAAGIPLVIFADQQIRYWDALAAADQGRFASFATFIDERAMDSMAMIADRLREAHKPLDEQVASIRERFKAHGGLTFAEIQAVGDRLAQQLTNAFTQRISQLTLAPNVITTYSGSAITDCTFWSQPYHLLDAAGSLVISFRSEPPVPVTVSVTVIVGLADDVADPFTYIAIDANRQTVAPLKVRVTDVHPLVTDAADVRIEGWVHQTISAAFDELQSGIDSGLQRQGISTRS